MSILHLPANPQQTAQARLTTDIVYSTATGEALTCAMITPWNAAHEPPHPAIVFVQGSAYQSPDLGYQIPQLCRYAQAGYVVMTVSHRNCMQGHPFPAILEDVKTAVRHLRSHAAKYHVDPERIGIWGSSSGGNTALLAAMTADDPRYKTEEYADFSDAVRCSVQCFGPTDMLTLFEYHKEGKYADLPRALAGEQDAETVMREMSPYRIAQKGKAYPPFLMIQGDSDTAVPWEQGEKMYRRLKEVGADVQLICIDGAPHEGAFWSTAVHDQVMAFLDKHLK